MKNRSKLIGLFSLAAFTFAVGGCQNMNDELDTLQNDEVKQGDKVQVTFQAVVPNIGTGESRTALVNDQNVYWDGGDAIAIFPYTVGNVSTDEYKFIADLPEGKKAPTASFTGYTDPCSELYTAFYPYELINGYSWYNDTDGELYFTLPIFQSAQAGSFAKNLNPAWAQTYTMGGNLEFKNIGALVKITLADMVEGLESITLADNAGKTLSGELVLNVSNPDAPFLSEYKYGSAVGSVILQGVFEAGQSYYFVVAPTESVFSEGFSLTFKKSDGTSFVKKGKAGAIADLQSSQIVDLGEISLKNAVFTKTITDLNFIAAVEQNYPINWVKNEDGTVTLTEENVVIIQNAPIEYLYINNAGICSLEGIEYFTNLISLECNNNQLIELDVTALEKLKYLMCDNNVLYELNIAGLASLMRVQCDYNQLTELNLDGLLSLRDLSCDNNNLSVLDVGSFNLKSLHCSNNRISELDVSNMSILRELICNHNNLSKLDVSSLTSLGWLNCSNNKISQLDVKNLKVLESLSCSYNEITALDVADLTELTDLYCWNNQIRTLDISGATSLVYVECYNNQIKELDLGSQGDLEALNCAQNQISVLDLSNLPKLRSLFCSGNLLVELDLSAQEHLTQISCIAQQTVSETDKLSLILGESMRDWWDSLSSYDQSRCEVTWVE